MESASCYDFTFWQSRMSLETILETPPGKNYDSKITPQTSFQRLNILCANNVSVVIDYASHLDNNSFFIKELENGSKVPFYLCHYWTRTWFEGSKNGSYFINLLNGDKYESISMSRWRGRLFISPDGNSLLIDEGITASSARLLTVYDIYDLNKIVEVYSEEFLFNPDFGDIHFNEKNEYVCSYIWDLWVYKNKISFRGAYETNEDFDKFALTDYNTINVGFNTLRYINDAEDIGGQTIQVEKTLYRKIERNITENNKANNMIITRTEYSPNYATYEKYMKPGLHNLE